MVNCPLCQSKDCLIKQVYHSKRTDLINRRLHCQVCLNRFTIEEKRFPGLTIFYLVNPPIGTPKYSGIDIDEVNKLLKEKRGVT